MNRQDSYAANIPTEPPGLEIVIDKDGDVWQRADITIGVQATWYCTKSKVASGFMVGNAAQWQTLLINFGPVKSIQWSDA